MLQTDLLDAIKNEFITFSGEIDSQIQKLRERELVSPEEIKRMKHNAEVHTEYMSRALSEPLDLVKEQLLKTYFNNYKVTMTQEINEFWGRLYSDDNFKNQLKKLLDQFYDDLANQISEKESKELERQLKKIENTLWNRFKSELKKQGENHRYKIGEKFIVQDLPKILQDIKEKILDVSNKTKLLEPSNISTTSGNNNESKNGQNQGDKPSTQSHSNNRWVIFENIGRIIDDVINNFRGSDT